MSEKILTAAFKRWRTRFLRQAMRILPSEEDAEDALQDAFIKLWPKAGDIETESDAAALASVTVRNISIDRYRRNKKIVDADFEGDEIADESEQESDILEQRIQVVDSIMNSILTQRQLEIIQMRDYEGKSFEEIGAKMKMAPTAVRMQLSRARKAIREEYRKQKFE